MVKEVWRELNQSKSISHVSFGMMSSGQMMRLSHVPCVDKDMYLADQNHSPTPHGVLDPRLGVCGKGKTCSTCNLNFEDCIGHFGVIDLELPVFHVGYLKSIKQVLTTICKVCARILLKPDDITKYRKQVIRPNLTYLQKKQVRKVIYEKARKNANCPYCFAKNGQVLKIGALKLVHMKFKASTSSGGAASKAKKDQMSDAVRKEFDSVLTNHKDLDETKIQEPINPVMALTLFEKIRDEDVPLLLMNKSVGKPSDLIMQKILVPPLCIRPSVASDFKAGTREDDLSVKLAEIIFLNDIIRTHYKKNARTQMVMEDWDYLQLQCALYINSQTPGIPSQYQPKVALRSLVQRLKGKQGRFRGNLSGKRVDFSGRTVISPDPNMRIDQVAVPVYVATNMTYPQRVTKSNIKQLQQMVINGPKRWPGANYVEKKPTKKSPKEVKFLGYGKRELVAKDLQFGDIVQRHVIDGDMVLFNRQPSLHKLSIMCHRVKVMPFRTFRFNECVCAPYNADFDGDEMNLHVPQTEEARAEAFILMRTTENMVTPKNGEPVIAATQDFLTASYLMTFKDTFFDKSRAMQIIASILVGPDEHLRIELPKPAILKPVRLWTGKQIYSLIIKPNSTSPVKANLRCKGKQYKSSKEDMDADDTFVVIRNSEIMCGLMEKGVLSSGSKNNLFYVLLRDYGSKVAADVMFRMCRISAFFLMNRGFSIGVGDVRPGLELNKAKAELIRVGYAKCTDLIDQAKCGQLSTQPGCTLDETLEAKILKELSTIRDQGGKACKANLPHTNSPLIMSLAGSKGSFINICQMVASVGQQALSGKRVPNGFESRSLPHFAKGSKEPEAKGFVADSFYSGLTPTEFFFHTMGGREGLVDTAVKTAETGYMQRRLVKCLEDLCVHYDTTVRNSTDEIVQFTYGADGLDPCYMEGDDKPVHFERLWNHMLCSVPVSPNEKPLDSADLIVLTEKLLKESNTSQVFKDDIRGFVGKFSGKLKNLSACVVKDPVASKLWKENKSALLQIYFVTEKQLEAFVNEALLRYERSIIEPGTAIGAVCAQSIGEPGTQMTLKTFHFAGVASMNITLGVPRIKEIINATKNISTPIIEAGLYNERDSTYARAVKGRIEKTYLGEVCDFLEEVYLQDDIFILVKVSMKRIKILQLEVNCHTIASSILQQPVKKIGCKLQTVKVLQKEDCLLVYIDLPNSKYSIAHTVTLVKENLAKVIVKGLAEVNRAVVSIDDSVSPPVYKLVVEGDDFDKVMSTYGVDFTRTKSNNTFEVARTLGIEAARSTIINEITYTMSSHGMSVDIRHVMLLADLMTYRGQICGMTRQGLSSFKDSVMMLASFERTSDHLFEAAYHGQTDCISGVSECIIMGIPMKVGTGLFQLLQKVHWQPKESRPLMFHNAIKAS
ncbi:DNA-directed RNA polymerase III subunit RPC1-like [Convolutriloba macropyga]|uniref:DNA-directed RNA polymerase III subunit RPC1-like n=1 Tax=Convolutriloba macropyga TaxID=536237 RepID=UPI003F51CF73